MYVLAQGLYKYRADTRVLIQYTGKSRKTVYVSVCESVQVDTNVRKYACVYVFVQFW